MWQDESTTPDTLNDATNPQGGKSNQDSAKNHRLYYCAEQVSHHPPGMRSLIVYNFCQWTYFFILIYFISYSNCKAFKLFLLSSNIDRSEFIHSFSHYHNDHITTEHFVPDIWCSKPASPIRNMTEQTPELTFLDLQCLHFTLNARKRASPWRLPSGRGQSSWACRWGWWWSEKVSFWSPFRWGLFNQLANSFCSFALSFCMWEPLMLLQCPGSNLHAHVFKCYIFLGLNCV